MMTLGYFFNREAASSAEPIFTGRCSASPLGPATSPPKPPRMTEMNERFMPRHMMYDRIAPDEPTSAPVMISAELPSVKPMPAAAQPEYELSIEITTGMSAPPIGMMINTPSNSDSPTMLQNSIVLWCR